MHGLEEKTSGPLVLDLSVRQLYGFAAVATTLSYARAAEQLHYTEPGLYVLIKRLEQVLGCRLFERDGRGLRLTSDGALLLPYCHSMLADLERMNQVRLRLSRRQHLTIVAGPSTGSYLLPDVIRAFEVEEPTIAVNLVIRQVEEIIDLVAAGTADIGLAGGIDHFPLPAHLSLTSWVEQEDTLLAGGGLPTTLREPIVVYTATRDARMPTDFRRRLEHLGIISCELRALPSTEAVKGACIAGLGYALIPRHAALLELSAGVLREVPGFLLAGQIWVCLPLEPHQSAATRAFVRYLHGPGTTLALEDQGMAPEARILPPQRTLPGELSDSLWARVEPLLPVHRAGRGRPPRSDRALLEGMLWVHTTGRKWRELPERFGAWQTVYGRFAFWRSLGVWERVLNELRAAGALPAQTEPLTETSGAGAALSQFPDAV
jgi:DNA-binding transcriptional LysR family regulator/transposase